MYFVVYLLPSKQNVVVPENWIREFDIHLEKFFNCGLNSSQKYVCFWTNNSAARNNGILQLNFQPDFNAPFSPTFPAEGFYKCMIRKAKGKFIRFIFENYPTFFFKKRRQIFFSLYII